MHTAEEGGWVSLQLIRLDTQLEFPFPFPFPLSFDPFFLFFPFLLYLANFGGGRGIWRGMGELSIWKMKND